jgi:predicted RNase H-like nuclease
MKSNIGIDGCKIGWFIFLMDGHDEFSYRVIASIEELKNHITSTDKVLIDIPIGLKISGAQERLCDKGARKLLGNRSSSVFPSPSRLALNATVYKEASAINRKNCGRGLSQQSFAILPKIKEVDEFLLAEGSNYSVREMHPEVCFWALNSQVPMQHNKKSSEGFDERLALLRKYAPNIDEVVAEILQTYKRKEVAKDDILDAAAGAITLRYAKELKTIPEEPEVDDKGLPMEMVYGVFK